MSYLVTGGAGFIGSHLVKALTARGDAVTVLDIAGREVLEERFADLSGVTYVQGDVLTEAEDLVPKAEKVVHLAADCGVRRVVDFPLTSMLNNLHATEAMFAACARTETQVLITSSSEVFGSNVGEVLHEDSLRRLGPPWKVRWSYGYAKALEEAMAFAYSKQEGLPVTVVRPFNVTGPGHAVGRAVIPSFVGQALSGSAVTVYGDGEQTRCFLHIDDAVTALLALIDGDFEGEAFNMGRAERVSMNELARMVTAACESDSPIVHLPYRDVYDAEFEDVEGRACDSSKLQLMTTWQPTRDTQDIVNDVVADALG